MPDMTTAEEQQQMVNLAQARREAQLAKDVAKAVAGGPMAKAKLALSFRQKVSEHWLILAVAVFFDLLGLIPVLNIISNFIFGCILFLYFGNKGNVPFLKSGLFMGGGIIIDFFLSIFPVCIGTTLYRIAVS